ncbi:GntR family transcriptional regulator [Mammaliicoccus sciuri]|uniref:FadR/GntR family transcriptional regulator n=1 Tax=Mammaliicoccus sciuri TaxID=1296 RepID=UPI000BBEFFEC|nr:GntR family transcriptional regulator [Mammaliicoccus sciuri]MDT0708686.1 GntR family transcriptional regulator [Mammaliicoccus sciuri]PCM41057.1 GntR family transcriptional regulator [Mammaliicoccus sciuri]UXU78099.1 GntR family transcriptional regulator [Mammaliicoccus sciuri]
MKLNKMTLTNKTVNNIEQYISDNHLKKGDKLPTEKEMMQLFNVGRSTLREAIKVLNYSDIVESIQGKGTIIKSSLFDITKSQRKIRDLQKMIELQALKEIDVSSITEETWLNLKETLILRNKYLEEGDMQNYLKFDLNYHKSIVDLAENAFLSKWFNEIYDLLFTYLSKLLAEPGNYAHNTELHNELYIYIKNGDIDKAIEINNQLGLNIEGEI